MTEFLDGPAAGVNLTLRRAPLFLRVTKDADGNFDALDQLEDTPRLDEEITVYYKTVDHGMIHLNMRDRKGKHCGGWRAMAKYRLFAEQPVEEIVRSKVKWRNWCELHKDVLQEQEQNNDTD